MYDSRIKAIFFDLDGTLRFSRPESIDTFHSLAAGLGLDWSHEREIEARRWIMEYWANSDELLRDLETFGNYPENGKFWKNHSIKHLRRLGAGEEESIWLAAEITERMRDDYQPVDWVPAETRETIRLLKEHGYILGVVSNRQQPFSELMTELELGDCFDFILAAGDVDLWKPDPRLLLHAASIVEIDPEATIYVGDNYFADVRSAQEAGMHPVLLDVYDLFATVDCPTIHSMGELMDVVKAIEEETIAW